MPLTAKQIWNFVSNAESTRIAGVQAAGWTFDLNSTTLVHGETGAAGYCVAYAATQNHFGEEGCKKAFKHAMEHDKYMGAWIDEGKCYFDSVKIYSKLTDALKAAKQEQQLAIFNINYNVVVYIDEKGNPLNIEKKPISLVEYWKKIRKKKYPG